MPDGDDEPSEEPGEDHDPRDIEGMPDEAAWAAKGEALSFNLSH